ncbi:MAG: YbaY family lipoprotein [Opitutaceae bacterium]
MKTALGLATAIAAFALVGCGHLDLASQGDPMRVLTGQVDLGDAIALPPDTTVTVRILDSTAVGMPPQVLGSQTIQNPGVAPVSFRIEYRAEDDVLIKGLNIDARVSFGGKVQYYNSSSYAVTLGSASENHRISVSPVGR